MDFRLGIRFQRGVRNGRWQSSGEKGRDARTGAVRSLEILLGEGLEAWGAERWRGQSHAV
jgi:hypothetical protein